MEESGVRAVNAVPVASFDVERHRGEMMAFAPVGSEVIPELSPDEDDLGT
jgi:hypothetical protein